MDEITRKLINARAYEIYEWRQSWGFEGSSLDDWYEAEIFILNELENKNQK